MYPNREINREIICYTLQILDQGFFPKGNKEVKLKLSKEKMKEIKVLLPDEVDEICSKTDIEPVFSSENCAFSCRNTDSFALAKSVLDKYGSDIYKSGAKRVLVLNLASPVNPGGGVRKGSTAQEEELCRNSSLLLSLESDAAKRYYNYNRAHRNMDNTYMGTDAMMFTPDVEVLKDEEGYFLDETFIVSVLTCAAPSIRNGKEGMSESEYREMVYNRIVKMLKCSAYFGYKYLVLGAWGCGAFRNDAKVISDLFCKAFNELEYCQMKTKDLFRRVDFAVLDRTREQYNFKEFQRNFNQENSYSVQR